LLIVGLVASAIGGSLAVIARRRSAPVGGSVLSTHWWKFVAAGPVIIGVVVAAAGLGVDAWFVGMFLVGLALVLTGIGLVLGLARLTARRLPTLPT
jgi:hypothetical protein